MRLGTETSSLVNHIKSNSKEGPKAGTGATILHWTDRSPVWVKEVSTDGKKAVLLPVNAKRVDTNGMSELQDYSYTVEEDGPEITVVKRWGKWRRKVKEIHLVDDTAHQRAIEDGVDLHNPDTASLRLVEGYTKVKTIYPEINIDWGKMEKYHDFSF